MGNYTVNINSTKRQIVGQLNIIAVKRLTGIEFTESEVYMYPGAIKHVKRKHTGIIEQYGHLIPDIIHTPDYIGQNPKKK